MPNEIKVEKTIFQNYGEFKVEFGKLRFKKSGVNESRGWRYFELEDYSNKADEVLLKHDLVYVGPTWEEINGKEWVVSRVYSITGIQFIEFRYPNKDSNHSNNPIQNGGGSITYWKRFMKSLAVDLIENDEVDAADPSVTYEVEKAEVRKATAKQVEMIKNLYDEENQAKMLEYYKIEKLEDLSIKDASALIQRKKG